MTREREFEDVLAVPSGDVDAAFRFYVERGFEVTPDDAEVLLMACGNAKELIRRVTERRVTERR